MTAVHMRCAEWLVAIARLWPSLWVWGYSEHRVSEAVYSNGRWCYWRGECPSPCVPRTPSHHFPWAGFQTRLHKQWGEQACPPGNHSSEIKNKEGLLPAAWAAGLSLPGHRDGWVHKQGGRWDSPFSSWEPSSSLCHPGICLLRFLFFSILKHK